MTEPGRRQRVGAYNVCLDGDHRMLVCRLTALTERPGWWTLPGGGVEFGEHPRDAARRELFEETGLRGEPRDVLEVDSIRRNIGSGACALDYHAVRIVFRTDVEAGELRHEHDGSTDLARWCTRAELAALDLTDVGRLGVRLAFGDT